MGEQIVPFLYVVAIGCVAIYLVYATLPITLLTRTRAVVLFIAVNFAGFFGGNFLLFCAIAGLAIWSATPRSDLTRIAAFFLLLPLLPTLNYQPSLAGIPLFQLNWPRLLTIVLLLPLAVSALRCKPLSLFPVDKYIFMFFLIYVAFAFRDATFTAGLRGSITSFLDIAVPYYVLSRHLKSEKDIKGVLSLFVVAMVFVGLINVLETARYWHLFDGIPAQLTGLGNPYAGAARAGFLRAYGPLDKPSASAFYLATSIGILWLVSADRKKQTGLIALAVILAAGLAVTFSRGSWGAAAIIGGAYLFAAPNSKQMIRGLLTVALVCAPVLLFTELGAKFASVLPFVGDDTGGEAAVTVQYRQTLLEVGLEVAHENPIFGAKGFQDHPALDALRIGSGFVDLVNNYLVLLLYFGYVGLGTFLAMMGSTLLFLRRKFEGVSANQRVVGKALQWTLLALLIALITTSAAGRVGLLLWCLVAVATACSGAGLNRGHALGDRRPA